MTLLVIRNEIRPDDRLSPNAPGNTHRRPAAAIGSGASPAAANDVCVHVHGTSRVNRTTTSSCSSTDTSMAIVVGDRSYALAEGDSNVALVVGDDSHATADQGSGNIAAVLGNESHATATGEDNTAIVIGNDSHANALDGSDNTALIVGDRSYAEAIDGSGNVARVYGDESRACARGTNDREVAVGNGQNAGCLN